MLIGNIQTGRSWLQTWKQQDLSKSESHLSNGLGGAFYAKVLPLFPIVYLLVKSRQKRSEEKAGDLALYHQGLENRVERILVA